VTASRGRREHGVQSVARPRFVEFLLIAARKEPIIGASSRKSECYAASDP